MSKGVHIELVKNKFVEYMDDEKIESESDQTFYTVGRKTFRQMP